MLTLINEILDLSRVEAGRYELKAEPVALNAVMDECRHLIALRAKKRDITITESSEAGIAAHLGGRSAPSVRSRSTFCRTR